MLSQALDKDTVLKVTMQIPPSLLSPIVMVCVLCVCVWCVCVVCVHAHVCIRECTHVSVHAVLWCLLYRAST